jgi:hypothetical protein
MWDHYLPRTSYICFSPSVWSISFTVIRASISVPSGEFESANLNTLRNTRADGHRIRTLTENRLLPTEISRLPLERLESYESDADPLSPCDDKIHNSRYARALLRSMRDLGQQPRYQGSQEISSAYRYLQKQGPLLLPLMR